MSSTTFAITIWSVIVLGWIGFLIIAGALVRDAATAIAAARRSNSATPSGIRARADDEGKAGE